ncbi:MAG: acetyl-CoA carboxylase biotin carboxylase subunit [Saprospiraceae bacterium]|nr:acetyl-CoA carboxylase biotin carboxylase subunit [Saprospiraceae bacterium]WKZ63284.1 MAG: acetyl-CoA carboxylase biotin carboxylase subunit [Saprospiraceae bacterium]
MNKILIANRGEIAVRVIKTCRKLGVKSVAVYSDADKLALHTTLADEGYHIGSNILSDSYLNAEKIIRVALESGAEAIHPGYGFLSENEDFARLVNDAGLIFIGPGPDAIRTMGNKLAAKEAVKAFNIPMVPGTDGIVKDKAIAKSAAIDAGFPILIKAAAGGGGKGMRTVYTESEFDEAYDRAVSEAVTAFKDGSVMIEKYVTKPRHIEIQIIADNHGNVCHLFERECSIQRRHQKVIEEAPSSILSEAMRQSMGRAACDAARACNYSGVGTVEFLVDDEKNFYFLEMNTRLQVEHPVTELITGLDLVEQQIRIAKGEKLSFVQEDLKINGHAIELRLYAEDSFNNFLPSTGVLNEYIEPTGKGIRVDAGYRKGDEISVYFDPLIAKLIVWGEDRNLAIQVMKAAIQQYQVSGLQTTLPFGAYVMNHPAFVTGNFDTGFVDKYYNSEVKAELEKNEAILAAIVAEYLSKNRHSVRPVHIERPSAWRINTW